MPDWRDAAAYEPLFHADRSLFAWEWLRRNRDYRDAADRAFEAGSRRDAAEAPERWGLHAFEPPGLTVPDARPLWSAERYPFVLPARAEPSPPHPDSFSLDHVRQLAVLGTSAGVERLLLSDGYRGIRIDVSGASLLGGPVRLHYQLSGIAEAKPRLCVLRRFLALATRGAYSRLLHPPDPRARRLVLLLRAHDAHREGADQRTMARELLSDRASEAGWRINSPSLRSQVQRLVRTARSMALGGFWDLLR